MSQFDSLGETTFSINDPTIEKAPPFEYTRAIAYNGSYWLAAGTIVIRSVGIKTFSTVKSYEESADYYNTNIYNDIFSNYSDAEIAARKIGFETEKKKRLDLAKVYFEEYKSKNYIPQSYTWRTVHCFAKSTDGYTWKYVEQCPIIERSIPDSLNISSNRPDGQFTRINSVSWNGSKWMAVGRTSNRVSAGNDWDDDVLDGGIVVESSDGENWEITGLGSPFVKPNLRVAYIVEGDTYPYKYGSEMSCVACDTTKWIVGGSNGLWKKGFTETSWTRIPTTANISTNPSHYRGIATDGTNWVAVGGGGGGYTPAAISSSTDGGATWSTRVNYELNEISFNSNQTFKAVAWNGDRWIAVGSRYISIYNQQTQQNDVTTTGLIARSEDGVDWTITSGFSTGLSCVAWDGNQWLVGSTNENILVSKDGFLWTPTTGSTSGVLTIATPIILPILGGDLNTVQSLLVGAGNPTSVLRTYNDTEWIPQILTDSKKQYQNEVRKNFYGAVWSGTKWLIVGEKDVLGRSIAVSENGIDWVYPTNTLGLGRCVAYGAGTYIAVGDKLVTSTDTETWTARTSPIKNLYCAAHNGTIWVAGGDGGVQYSTNGTTWTKSTTCPLSFVRGVAWNGSYWVGTGTGSTHSVMLSKDGMRWYIADSTSIPFSDGFSVAWNRTIWIATGAGSLPVARSYDGYTWESIPSTPLTNGQYVAWTGSAWIVSGYGNTPIISSTDTITWTEYPVLLTRGSAYASKNVSLPYIGTTSQAVLDKANIILADLTAKITVTIAEEEAAAKLAADQVAQAAALAKRNATKTKATEYLTRITFWNTTVAAQFAPFDDTTYVDISSVYPLDYNTVKSTKIQSDNIFASANVYRDRIYDDTRSQEAIDFDLDNLANSVKLCEENMVDFYNSVRVLYSEFADQVYTAIAVTPGLLDIVDGMEFSTQTRTDVRNFIIAKQTALETIRDDFVATCATQVLDVSYSNESTDATDYATLFKNLISIDQNTLGSATYQSDDTNPFYYLSIWNYLYPKIYARKLECDAIVTAAHTDAVSWATLLETTPPTLQSVKDDFEPVYEKYFRSVGTFGYPQTTFDTPNKLINLTDTPVKSFRAIANDYKNPLAYPTGLQALYSRLKTTTDTVESTRQAAINYMINKRKTTLKTKLDDIYSVTKTKYTGPLSLDAHISKITGIVYSKDSNYQFCIDLLKKLKNGYTFGTTLRQKVNDIELADIAAEEDGCSPPTGGWGVSARSYASFNFPLSTGLEFTTASSRGNRYLIGDEIVIPGTSFKGLSPTNDITITVKDVGDFDGTISRWEATGTFPSQSTPYIGLVGSRQQNTSADFNVTPSGSGYTVQQVLFEAGTGYVVGQKISLSGTNFRRKTPANDVLINITGVDGVGRITSFTSSGSSTISTYDDIHGYKNCSCAFTFLQGLVGMPSGQNFIIFLENGGVGYKVGDKIVYEGTRFGGLSPANDITITVASVNASGTILTFTYEGTPSTLCTYGFTLNPIENTTATFTFSSITNSTTYTAAVKNGGSNYRVGERLLVPGTSFAGGKSPANDFLIKVNSVSAAGAILTISVEGSFSFLFEQFTASGNVVEQNAYFDVIVNYAPTQDYTVSLRSPGDGYIINELIVIPGTLLSGSSPANDLSILVTGVSGNGEITTFTSSGTPKTEFRISTKPAKTETPYKTGRYGLNGWQYFNDTFAKRDELARYMYSNSISDFGALRTYSLPDISGTDSIRWRTFLDFISTSTYDTIVDAIEELENKVSLLNSNSELTEGYADGLVTADLSTIQSKYIEFATAYTQSLLDSVHTIIASAKFSVAKSSGSYTATLVNSGYGYEADEDLTFLGTSFGGSAPSNNLVLTVKTVGPSGQILTFIKKSGTASAGTATYVVSNDKLADRFTEIADAQATIEANYSTLYSAPGSIAGKTNEQIATIVTDAITAKNTITSIQNNNVGFPTIIQKAINYLKYYNQAKTTVLDYEDDLVRWIRMKRNAYNKSPFYEPKLSNGIGEPFIMSIPPTNTNFWAPITYTLYKTDPKSETIYQCTLDQQTQKVKTSLDPIDITTIDAYSATQKYTEGMYVKYNNTIYICKKDNTPETLSVTSQTGVKGISPLEQTNCWVNRKYPYVIDGNEEVEFNDSMCVPFDSEQFLTYSATREYKLGTIVKFEGNTYVCSKTVNSESTILNISPENSTYWKEITYPLVRTLQGLQFEAKPASFSAVDPATLTDALTNSFKFGNFAKTTATYVDDQGYYRTGTFTFQLDQEPTSTVSKGYSPVFTYANGDKYQNYQMWEYVQAGRLPNTNHPTYSDSSVYKRDDYVVYTGSFIKQDGTTTSNVLHTFKLIATYPSETSYYGNSIIYPFYKSTAGYPVARKITGVLPTETPWTNIGLATLSDTGIPFYSNDTEYNLNDIVRYTNSGTTYKYRFDGTMPKYSNAVYIYFGTVSGNKNPWSLRSYPGVYYNGTIVEPAPGNIPALNPANYNAYDEEQSYSAGDYVSYNNKVYLCGFAKVGVLYGIPVSNDKYWTPIRYKLITYNGDTIQAAPGSVPKLDPDDYDEYNETTTYTVGEIVKVTQPASNLNLSSPQDVVTDRQGNIYVMDRGNKIIKKGIAEVDEYIVANIGIPGGDSTLWTVDGTTSSARYYQLGAVDIDNATDTIYFTDDGTIRKITENGAVSTIAGYLYLNGILSGYVNGTGTAAKFSHTLDGLTFDGDQNCLYVSDSSNNVIRKVDLSNNAVTTLAGPLTAQAGAFANGTTTDARFNNPTDMDIDSDGNLYVADTGNHCIRKITPQGVVTTLAGYGGSAGYFDSTGTSARFSSPRGIAVDDSGNVFVADTGNNRIRRITPQGVVTTFAGTGVAGFANGSSDSAKFSSPRGLSIDRYGNIYVSDTGNNQVRKIRSDGRVSTAIRARVTIHECVSYYQSRTPIVNVPPTNSVYWETRTYPIVYVNKVPYEANPNNTSVFKALNQYDYHRYDNNWMYQFGDLTSYNGQVYQCINTVPVGQPSSVITDIPPTNTLHWEEVNNDESLLTSTRGWIKGSTYKIGDVVRYLTGLFRCKVGHVASDDDLPNRPNKWAVYTTYYPGAAIWSSDTVYEADTVIVYNNKQYKCLIKHKSSSTEVPTRVIKWESVNQIKASNIIEWDLNVQYLVGTIVIYNGYFYRCEVEHYSTYVDSPYGNKYYWTQITDLQTIGVPEFYDSTSEYTTKTVVSLRVPNTGLKKHDDDNFNVKFYKCIKTDPDYPFEFTYDSLAIIDSTDADGNYEYAKVPGTWNKSDLPRYGLADDDPFRVPGFAGKLRRRVWMEIEMPYGRVEYLNTVQKMIDDYGIGGTMSRLFSFLSSNSQVITPTDYQTDYDFVKDKLQTSVNNFVDTITGTGEDKLLIEDIIANAYKLITEDIKTRKSVPYIINTDFNGIAEGDENKCIDQLIEEVNVMKTQYFYNPATQTAIQDDPYYYMSPIALAQDPPKKLFKDLGVGDIAEITASVNEQEGISNVTYNPDGTLTFGEGYGVATSAKRKYGRADLEYALERTNVMNSKLELVSMSCFEVKQKIGFGIAMKMQASDSKMGGRFQCDSGTFDLPIGEYPVLPRYSNYGDTEKMMYNFYQLIQSSLKPPEYTLPESQASRDLAVLTFESQNAFVKGLSATAKGLVGLAVSYFGGQVTGITDLINGIASLHAMVQRWRGKEVDEATEAVIEMTNVNFVKFNQNNDSINSLKEQANYYREAAKRPLLPIEEDQEKEEGRIGKLLQRIEYLLFYAEQFGGEAEYELVERTINLPPPAEVPIAPNQPRTVFQKPNVPENKALKSLKELKDYKARLLIERMNLESALARNYGHPPLPTFTKDIPTRQVEEVTRSVEVSPENVEEYANLQKETRAIEIRIEVQSTTITTNTELIRSSESTLITTRSDFSYMDTLRSDMKTWIGPPAVTPDRTSVTVGNATFNPSTMTRNELLDLQNKVIDRHSLLKTNVANLEQTIAKAKIDISDATRLRKLEIEKLSGLQTRTSSWLTQWRAANPNKSVVELIPEDNASFEKRIAQFEVEKEYHRALVEEIKAEASKSEMRRKAAIKGRLDLNTEEMSALQKEMTDVEFENKAIQLENQRAHKQYRAELAAAEAEEAVAEQNYRKAMAAYKKELTAAKYKNAVRRREMQMAIKEAFDNANEYFEVLNQKKQVTAIKYLAYEEVLTAEYHITGTFIERLLKNAIAIPFELLLTAINLTMGIGEVPYRVQELITGRYFYSKLPASAKARIDAISEQLNAIPDKVGARLQSVVAEHIDDFVKFINRRRRFKILVNSNPRLAKRGFGTIFAGRTGKAASRLLSGIKLATSLSLNTLGSTPKERFLGGLGVAAEVAGAAMGAWQGGAFDEAATLGV